MNKQTGFTLIELMIVVSVIAILSSIAYNSYQKSVIKSNRAEAKAELSLVAGRLQGCYSMYGNYATTVCDVYVQMKDGGVINSSGRGYYAVDLVNATTTTYTIEAVPIKTPQTKDKDCVKMQLAHTGARSATDNQNNPSTSKCW
jgi:type IV pilus assembly protein PilE